MFLMSALFKMQNNDNTNRSIGHLSLEVPFDVLRTHPLKFDLFLPSVHFKKLFVFFLLHYVPLSF